MGKIAFQCVLIFSVAFPFFGFSKTGDPQKSPRYNILFISVDDLRPELGCYGSSQIKSPHIDQFARQGILFERAYCQSAQCTPSRSSLLTGIRPEKLNNFGFWEKYQDKFPNLTSLPHYFRDHGYLTANFGKTFSRDPNYIEDPPSWDQFYTTMRGWYGPKGYSYLLNVIAKLPEYSGVNYERDYYPDKFHALRSRGDAYESVETDDRNLMDGLVREEAVNFLREYDKQKPFFISVGFIRPHLPFVAPKKYWDLYDNQCIALAENYFYPRNAPEYARYDSIEFRTFTDIPKKGPFSPQLQRTLRQGYYACVSYIDAQIGALLDALKRKGVERNTIVVLWGDHGYNLGENGIWGKLTNYELAVRVPLIISVPEMKNAGKRTRALTELVDIYPTLVDLAGLPAKEELEGTSFRSVLENPRIRWKKAAFSAYPGHPDVRNKADGRYDHFGYAMRTEQYRFVKWVDRNSNAVAYELYDHYKDLQENENLAGRPEYHPQILSLAAELDRGWKGALP